MPAFKHFDPDAFLRNHADTLANLANPAKVDHALDKIAQDSPLSPPLDGEKCTDEEVAEWLRQNPPPSGQHDLCSHCGNVISDTDPKVIDATTGADRPPEFHAMCHANWLAARKKQARDELHRLFRDQANTDENS